MSRRFSIFSVGLFLCFCASLRTLAAKNCEGPLGALSDSEIIKSLYAPPKKPKPPKAPSPALRVSPESARRLQDLLNAAVGSGRPPGTLSTEALLDLAKRKLAPEEAQAFSDWLQGQFFEDPLVSFEDHFLGRQRQLFPTGPTRYNKNGERPFEGYLAARNFLQFLPLGEVKLETLLEAHKRLMSRDSIRGDKGKVFQADRTPARNSQGLKDSELGTIRSESVGFEVEGGMVPSALNGIGHRVADIDRDNIYVKQVRNGSLSYAPLFRWRTIDSRKPFSDAFVKRMVELEKKYGTTGLRELSTPELAEAQNAMLTELTERTWKEAVADVQAAQTQGEVIAAAARFQKDFISIHPFLDGNGRLARLLTEKLLESKGLSAPLYSHWGEDVALSQEQLEGQIAHGVLLSRDYHSALAAALAKGESFTSVPQPVVSLRARELLGGHQEPWNDPAFLAWVEKNRDSLRSFPEAVRRFYDSAQYFKEGLPSAFELWKKNQEELPQRNDAQWEAYDAWRRRHQATAGGKEIRLVPGVFQKSFGRLSESEMEFAAKMAAAYTDKPIYRGIPVDRYLGDEELARLFARPSPLTTGNGIPLSENPDSHFPVFQNFNQELLRGGEFLEAQVRAHTDGTQSEYFTSGMVSFTDQEGIGRNWQFSTLQSVGILITARERTVGVIHTGQDTDRFGKLGLQHEYEHALVGGADPESILGIEVKQQTQDPQNKVQRKTKKAKRINFNTVQITEVSFDGDMPKIGKSTLWRIEPDGSVRELRDAE